jgi:hypothetical protein
VIRSILGVCITAMALCTTFGCSSSVSIPKWQESVEQFVRTDGRGDPSILRNTTLQEGKAGFGLIAADDPRSSTDAKGLLLAHKQVNGKPWFIYLVGLVTKQEVTELQLAALNVQGGQFHWALGKSDANALKAYKNYNEGVGKTRSGQPKAPAKYHEFPQEGDVFDVTVDQNRVTAVHQPSGAHWTLSVGR